MLKLTTTTFTPLIFSISYWWWWYDTLCSNRWWVAWTICQPQRRILIFQSSRWNIFLKVESLIFIFVVQFCWSWWCEITFWSCLIFATICKILVLIPYALSKSICFSLYYVTVSIRFNSALAWNVMSLSFNFLSWILIRYALGARLWILWLLIFDFSSFLRLLLRLFEQGKFSYFWTNLFLDNT